MKGEQMQTLISTYHDRLPRDPPIPIKALEKSFFWNSKEKVDPVVGGSGWAKLSNRISAPFLPPPATVKRESCTTTLQGSGVL